MEKRTVSPQGGPPAKGPYSPAVIAGDFVFLSGQIPLDPAGGRGEISRGDIAQQAELVFQNIKFLLEEAGSSLSKVIKTTLYLADMADFGKVNEIYARHFGPDFPARTCIQAAKLPLDVKIEVEVIAHRSSRQPPQDLPGVRS
jgi:2-iminobutanoate/2-iminopropanoate deaminase